MECYFRLAEQFRTQDDPAFCGLSTLTMVLNALAIDPGRIWKGKVTIIKSASTCTYVNDGGLYSTFSFFFRTLLLSSFWTSRGHRCRPFFPPVLAFHVFIAHRVQQPHCSSIFHRVLLKLKLSRFPQVNLCARKSPHEIIRVCTGGDSNSRN